MLLHDNGDNLADLGGQAQRILSPVNITAYRLTSRAVFCFMPETIRME
ncbi:MAG: hypothetical protein GY805_19965 [Chloroflexi bacterium]|nr:hypothetical protein [Chloroflexota bacterium]